MTNADQSPLEQILAQSQTLYSPPEVALEIVRLTETDEVDLRAIRTCLERDPALAGKLLRVVNSSLYGLKGEVSDLNQAIALLGVLPLKMLVLGFALPDKLFTNIMGDVLKRYWTETITRGAAARLIAKLGWSSGSDEAQLAGLMQGIGQLVLMQQFGTSYTSLLDAADQVPSQTDLLRKKEIETIGLDHRELSAELIKSWGLPKHLVEAISLQTTPEQLVLSKHADIAPLAQTLRLADLLTQLVVFKRLKMLPPLIEEGRTYCQLTRRQINSLVEELQPMVSQLAEGMLIELDGKKDYEEVLLQAHTQLSMASEQGASVLFGVKPPREELDQDDQLCQELLEESEALSQAVKDFMNRGISDSQESFDNKKAHAGNDSSRPPHHRTVRQGRDVLIQEVDWLAASCRKSRTSLALATLEFHADQASGMTTDEVEQIQRQWAKYFQEHPRFDEIEKMRWVALTQGRIALIFKGIERMELSRMLAETATEFDFEYQIMIDAGVSSVAQIPANFEAVKLIDASKRCLDAALATSSSTVKSIEVY